MVDRTKGERRDGVKADTVIYGLFESDTGELRYVGKTAQLLRDRLCAHLSDRRKCHRASWIAAVRARGARVEIAVIETVPPGGDWKEAERRLIAHHRDLGARLVNSTGGGEGLHEPSPELRAKLRFNRLGKKTPRDVVERHRRFMTGRKRPPEECARISASSKGKVISPETREKISAKLRGRTLTEEHRRNISAAQTGRPMSDRRKAAFDEARKRVDCAARGRNGGETKRRQSLDPGWRKKQLANLGAAAALTLVLEQVVLARALRARGLSYRLVGESLGIGGPLARRAVLGLGGYSEM